MKLAELLNPPQSVGATVKDAVEYLKSTYVHTEIYATLDRIDDICSTSFQDEGLIAMHSRFFDIFRGLADANIHLLKKESSRLIEYEEKLHSNQLDKAKEFLSAAIYEMSQAYQQDISYLGRRLESMEQGNDLRPQPRLRPEAGIKDTDYKLQRLSIDLTTVCNYRCLKCWRSDEVTGIPRNMDFEILKKIIDEGLEIGVQDFGLMGGEPTAYRHFDDMVRYFQKKAEHHHGLPFYAILFTNGSRLFIDEERRALIKDSSFLDIWISIETFDRERYPEIHGCQPKYYDTVMKNLEIAIEDGLVDQGRVAIVYTQTKNNVAFSEEVWRFCRETGILPRFTFWCKAGRAEELWPEITFNEVEIANVIKTVCAVDASLGYKTVHSHNAIGVDPFKAFNFLGIDADGKTWDFYINIEGLDVKRYSLSQIWRMNMDKLNDEEFLRAQLGSTFKRTREFAQKRIEELQNGKRI